MNHCIHDQLCGLDLVVDYDQDGKWIEVVDYGVLINFPHSATSIKLFCKNDKDPSRANSFATWFGCVFEDYGIEIFLMPNADFGDFDEENVIEY